MATTRHKSTTTTRKATMVVLFTLDEILQKGLELCGFDRRVECKADYHRCGGKGKDGSARHVTEVSPWALVHFLRNRQFKSIVTFL